MTSAAAPVPRVGASGSALVLAAAGLSFGAALVHASVIATHFREYWLFGLFFALVTPLQVLWAGLVVHRPENRDLLLAGAAGSLVIAAIWVFSRLFGLPLGPHPFEPEAVGAKDLLATYAEFGVVLIAMLALRSSKPGASSWLLVPAWVLTVLCVLAAFVAGH